MEKYAVIKIMVYAPKEKIDKEELKLSDELFDIKEKLASFLQDISDNMDFEILDEFEG